MNARLSISQRLAAAGICRASITFQRDGLTYSAPAPGWVRISDGAKVPDAEAEKIIFGIRLDMVRPVTSPTTVTTSGPAPGEAVR